MKKQLYFLVLLFSFSTTAFSQEQYVEILVKDTVLATPKQWLYSVSIATDYETVMPMMDTMASPTVVPKQKGKTAIKPKRTSLEEIQTLAKRFNGQADNGDWQAFTVVRRTAYSADAITLVFDNKQSLSDFVQALSVFKDVDGRLVDVSVNKSTGDLLRLDSRLITMARTRAENLAQLSGRKLGSVLLISEDTETSNASFQTFLQNIFRYDGMRGKGGDVSFINDRITMERTLKVRFALL